MIMKKIKLIGGSSLLLFLAIAAYCQAKLPKMPGNEVYHTSKLISENDKDAIIKELKKYDPNSYSVIIYTSKGKYMMGKGLGSVKQEIKNYSVAGTDAVATSGDGPKSGSAGNVLSSNGGSGTGLKTILNKYK
jgi:hypothetical protein